GAAAEADEADALAGDDRFALAQCRDDTARDQPGDLHHGNVATGGREPGCHALIVAARLVEARIEKFSRAVGKLGDVAGHRRAVHMYVEDAHEDGDPAHPLRAETEL